MTLQIPLQEQIPLKEYCTFGIGGPARYLIEVRKIEEMLQAILWCRQTSIPYLVIGKGSNCLFDDKGYCGAIIVNKIEFMEEVTPGTFHAGAGYSFALLGVQTARKGWSGLEFASGIPASIGGAVFMNAGANGMETSETLISVDFIHHNGTFEIIQKEDLQFSYRYSSFQKQQGAIVGATFTLKKNSDARAQQISIVNKRKQTQPYGSMSAGCVFLNPACNHAGALIEQCGLKGYAVGDARVSDIHANFLINTGSATCQDMNTLISIVKSKVKEQTGIELHSEVRYIPPGDMKSP